jgi:hypothetical protein
MRITLGFTNLYEQKLTDSIPTSLACTFGPVLEVTTIVQRNSFKKLINYMEPEALTNGGLMKHTNNKYWLFPSLVVALGFTISMNHETARFMVRNEISKPLHEMQLASEGIQKEKNEVYELNGVKFDVNYKLNEDKTGTFSISFKNEEDKKKLKDVNLASKLCITCTTSSTYRVDNIEELSVIFKTLIQPATPPVVAANAAAAPAQPEAKPAEPSKKEKQDEEKAAKNAVDKYLKQLAEKCKSKKESAAPKCHIDVLTKFAKKMEKSPDSIFKDSDDNLDTEKLKDAVTSYFDQFIKDDLEGLLSANRFDHDNYDYPLGYNAYYGVIMGNFDKYSKDSEKFDTGKELAQMLVKGLSKASGEDVRTEIRDILKSSYQDEKRNAARLIMEGKEDNNAYKVNSGLAMAKDLYADVNNFNRQMRDIYSESKLGDAAYDKAYRSDWVGSLLKELSRIYTNPNSVTSSDGTYNPYNIGSRVRDNGINFPIPQPGTTRPAQQPTASFINQNNSRPPWDNRSANRNF